MWGIFIGSAMFVFGMRFQPERLDWIGFLLAAVGMTLALVATARYAANLLTPESFIRETVYDVKGAASTSAEPPAV